MHAVSAPRLSVVVVAYNIPQALPRTLMSLSASCQRDLAAESYEVIVVDNGSNTPVVLDQYDFPTTNMRVVRIEDAHSSPAGAVNAGIAAARGEVIGVMIDGARMVSPGLLGFALRGAELHARAVVATLGWYLGHDYQCIAMQMGHDAAAEAALLASIGWPDDGYRLFEIATLDESSTDGWFTPPHESNALFLHRDLWRELGGYDEAFDAPGGGLVNLDSFVRALALPGAQPVLLLGEGTFHQFHGGTSTNSLPARRIEQWHAWTAQYRALRGHDYVGPRFARPAIHVGGAAAGRAAAFGARVAASRFGAGCAARGGVRCIALGGRCGAS